MLLQQTQPIVSQVSSSSGEAIGLHRTFAGAENR
jgi:hypothetical protein